MGNNQNQFFLLSDFPPISTEEWKKKIQEDLKGESFEKLIWEAPGKLKIDPFYRLEDLKNIEGLDNIPIIISKSGKKRSNKWIIQQNIKISDFKKANDAALDALKHGASGICFILQEKHKVSSADLDSLFRNLSFKDLSLSFQSSGNERNILDYFITNILSTDIFPEGLILSLNFDPLGHFASTGNFYSSETEDFNTCLDLINRSSDINPLVKVISINSHIFHNAGATAVQELALSLATLSEYLYHFKKKGIGIEKIKGAFRFNMAAGPLYFIEIAKFRVARLLFTQVLKAWGASDDISESIFIHAINSGLNQTIFNPYMNILRGTTEAMSAILGGADSLTIIPSGHIFNANPELEERIYRNIQLILKEEASFNKVIDPAAGSWYIETITNILAEEAWKLFLDIENKGGFIKSFKSSYIQKMINEAASEQRKNVSTRKCGLTGINIYPDPAENPEIDSLKDTLDAETKKSGNIIAEALPKYRVSTKLENLRIRALKMKNARPAVFLLGYGDPKFSASRGVFITDFFACAGYKILPLRYFSDIEEGIKAALKASASIVVLCSSDDQYEIIAPEAANMLENKAILVIAGYPESADQLKSLGIEHFIHINSDLYEEIEKFHDLLGINYYTNS